MLKLKVQYFGHWCKEPTQWKRPWCWERLRAGKGGDKGRDGWMASLTQWTWVWANSGREWRTGKPGVLHSMGHKELDMTEWLNNNNMHFGASQNGKESACQCRRCELDPRVWKIPWRRKWQPIPVILAWEIPWTEEPGGLQSVGLQRVGHNWARTHVYSLMLIMEKICQVAFFFIWHFTLYITVRFMPA